MTALRDDPKADAAAVFGPVATKAVGQGAIPAGAQALAAGVWTWLDNPPVQALTPDADDTGNATVIAFARCSFYPTTANATKIQLAVACYNGAVLVQRIVVAQPYRGNQQHMDGWGTAKFRIPGGVAYEFRLEANPSFAAQEDQNDHSSLVVVQL